MSLTPEPPPPLPEPVAPETLRELDVDALDGIVEELRAVERATIAAMAPYDQQLRELRARAAQVATEHRRRERAERTAARLAVRQQAKSGEMPTLGEALEASEPVFPEDASLADVRVYLATGGEVRFGYPTRPGTINFTDGRAALAARTWGEALRLHAEGLEPGTATVPGVRIHLVGTRIEKVLPASEVLIGVT